jgi:hypothetical protein
MMMIEQRAGFKTHDALGNRKLLWHGTNIAVGTKYVFDVKVHEI